VSELTGRARANVYFSNSQGIFQGAQVNFVNVGSGNLTFSRRDLVTGGRIPLVLARVYDSSSQGSPEFGVGWTLSAAETISMQDHVARLFSEAGSVIDFAEAGSNTFVLRKDHPSDYSLLRRTAADTLQATLRTGFVKEYKLIGNLYRLTRVVDRNGNEVRLSYRNGALSRIQNAGHFVELTRNSQGYIAAAQDDLGRQVRYSYDSKGRLIEAEDVGGTPWRYGYGDDGRLSAALDPMQRLNFGVVYDGAGHVRRLQLPSGAIQYRYDPGNRSTTVVDRRALSSRYFQNEEGITTRVVNTLGEETAIGLDAARNPISLSRNGAVIESMEYDQQHRLQLRHSVTSSGTIDTHYTYDPGSGLLTRADSSSGTSRAFTYDASGNVTSAVLDDGLHEYGYSASGDLSAYSVAGNNLTFTSSPDGLIASMKEGAGVTSTFAYNGGGELSQADFADGRSARHEYQSSGLRARLVYKDGRRVEYGYDPAGNLTSTKVFDAKGNQSNGQKLALNDAYQVIGRSLFDGTEETFQYDPSGNLTVHTVGRAVTRFEYDELNRLVAVVTPTGERLTYGYEPGERSIVEEYEHSSLQVADLRDTGFTFASPAQVMSTRPVTAGWGTLRFSENLGTFQLANAAGKEIITPEAPVEQPLHKLALVADRIPLQDRQSAFNRPFNTMFMPAEYATINCCPECYLSSGHGICPPCDPPPDPPPPPPKITSISPAQGLIGTTVSVTISGQGFGTSPTVQTGPGIAVAVASANSTTINASFAIAPNAPVGNSGVTVTVSTPDGGTVTSNSVNFTVTPAFTVRYNAYIAVDHITSATSCLFAGTFNTPYIYIGDANRGTYRAAEQLGVIPDLQQSSNFFNDIGESRNYGQGSPANGSTLSSRDEDGIPNDCYLWNNAKKTPQATTYDVSYPYAHQAQVHYVGSVFNSLESSAATITWDMRTVLDTTNPQSPTAYVNYNHTCYPAHIIRVNGAVVYSYIPPSNSPQQLLNCLVFHDTKVVGQTQPMVVPTH
jgi:YD repeat-containing protein